MDVNDDTAFEEVVEFNEQREFLGKFLPLHNYFLDWVLDIFCELQGKVSPFSYATRVSVAQRHVEHINLEHATASQKILQRVIRNLFPYDRVDSSSMTSSLSKCLGIGREIKTRPYRPLYDPIVKSKELVALRYSVLVKAIIGYTMSLTRVLHDTLSEEDIPDYRHFHEDTIRECQEDMDELKRYRDYLYFDFPAEEVCTVSSYAESLQDKLKKRKEMPREMDADQIAQTINKLQQVLRGKMQAIIIKGKDIMGIIIRQKEKYVAQINELNMMISVLQSFLSTEADWHAIEDETKRFLKVVDEKFRLDLYLPADVLEDINAGNVMYRKGYIPRMK
ncbi:MAG: hypothetical protein J6333_02540 [Planctomycetes bacterium]|nr:hypothetical protein [Planctomycetota bacterium]